jgi:Serine dehydratase beta chain
MLSLRIGKTSLSSRYIHQIAGHAVISTFDLFSIGGKSYLFTFFSSSTPLVGPSSSHTVGPMRAAKIFITDLKDLNLLEKARKKIV